MMVKCRLTTITLLCLITHILYSQSVKCGVYITAKDFANHHLSLDADSSRGCKIMRVPYRAVIIMNHKGQKLRLRYRDIKGFRDIDGKEYRIFGEYKLKIVNEDELILYDMYEDTGFGEIVNFEHQYFFSETLITAMHLLTKANLAKVFWRNTTFITSVNKMFANDKALTASMTSPGSCYQIARLFKQSLPERE